MNNILFKKNNDKLEYKVNDSILSLLADRNKIGRLQLGESFNLTDMLISKINNIQDNLKGKNIKLNKEVRDSLSSIADKLKNLSIQKTKDIVESYNTVISKMSDLEILGYDKTDIERIFLKILWEVIREFQKTHSCIKIS